MKLNDLIDLDVPYLVEFMRTSGIKHIRYHDVELTLTDTVAPVKALIEPSNFEDDMQKEICSCEHSMFEHNEANECLHGCDSDRCGKEDK